jgi:hypothetical protein
LQSVIELHDTRLVAVVEVGTQVIVLLRAYVHRSRGRPAWDSGSGWIQAAVLTFADGKIEGILPALPADIWHGDWIVEGKVSANMLPIPLHQTGEIALTLQLDTPAEITLRGKEALLTLIGDAVYVEEFPGAGNV